MPCFRTRQGLLEMDFCRWRSGPPAHSLAVNLDRDSKLVDISGTAELRTERTKTGSRPVRTRLYRVGENAACEHFQQAG